MRRRALAAPCFAMRRQRPRARRDQRASALSAARRAAAPPSSNSGSASRLSHWSRCVACRALPRCPTTWTRTRISRQSMPSRASALRRSGRTLAQRRSDRARGCRELQDAFPPVGHVHPLGNRSRQMPADSSCVNCGLAAMPRRPFGELRVRLEHARKRRYFGGDAQRLSRTGKGSARHWNVIQRRSGRPSWHEA